MNRDRRRAAQKIIEAINAAQALIAPALEEAERLRDDEEAVLENLPDGLRDSEQGERMDEARTALASAFDHLDTLMQAGEDAADELRAAIDA